MTELEPSNTQSPEVPDIDEAMLRLKSTMNGLLWVEYYQRYEVPPHLSEGIIAIIGTRMIKMMDDQELMVAIRDQAADIITKDNISFNEADFEIAFNSLYSKYLADRVTDQQIHKKPLDWLPS